MGFSGVTPHFAFGLRITTWICLAAMVLVLQSAVSAIPEIADIQVRSDNDDLARLVEVRDWLGGQSWFDLRQYRILPPDGISMHWSRYVDLGIGLLILAASTVLPPLQAELATLILWPSLLACLMILVICHGTNRLFGAAAAIGALAAFLTWNKFTFEFGPGRIDHHSLQMLCVTSVFFLAILPDRPRLYGAMAGLLAALSLALGLEMLPVLALIWGMAILRLAIGQAEARLWLLGFCPAIAVAAPTLMFGQTQVAEWFMPRCDVLATPVLALGGVGILASVVPMLVPARSLLRLVVSGLVAAAGIWLAGPLLGPCGAGPYANAPVEVQEFIETQIIEALPIGLMLQTYPRLLAGIWLSPLVIALFGCVVLLACRHRMSRVQNTALVQALAVLFFGLGVSILQARAINFSAPALPLAAGILVHAFVGLPRQSRLRLPAALLLLLSQPTTLQIGAASAFLAFPKLDPKPEDQADAAMKWHDKACRDHDALAEVASLPQSLIFSRLDFGPAILAYSAHSVTSAPYHRSPDALWNGFGAFRTMENLRAALEKTGADYVVLCVAAQDADSAPFLAQSSLPPWLVEVTGDRKQVRVLRVDKLALAGPPAAP